MAIIVEFRGVRPTIADTAFVAATAVLVGDVHIGPLASVWFGAVLRADFAPIRVGAGSNIQDNVVIHSERGQGTVIEERVTIGHAAVVHNCWIGQNSLIGMRAVLLTDCRIGPESLVGAGSVVREGFEVPAHTLAIGNPAVNKGPLRGKAAKWIATAAEEYMQLLRSYR